MGDLEKQIEERIAEMEANKEKKSLMLFGRDVTKIPCFKQSWFTGILSGVGAGIAVFMFTSRPQLATHSMVGTCGAVTMAYYSVCRYQYAKEKNLIENMKGLMREAMVSEGIEHQEKIEEITKLVEG